MWRRVSLTQRDSVAVEVLVEDVVDFFDLACWAGSAEEVADLPERAVRAVTRRKNSKK